MTFIDTELFTRGGPMTWVLLALALAGLVLGIERFVFLRRNHIRSVAFIDGIKNILAKRRIVEALTVCEETPGPVSAVVKTALLHADDETEKLRFSVQEAAIVELPALERRLGSLAAIAQVAPLVGLLGTMLGMITIFQDYQQGFMTPADLATGMWQALITAAGSLMIAIPAYLAHHFFSGQVRAIVQDVEWAANEIMRYLRTEYRDPTHPGRPDTASPVAPPTAAK